MPAPGAWTDRAAQQVPTIKSKDTGPEMQVRRLLHSLGFRYRLHRGDMSGCPDLLFPKLRAVVFVHGCFWHVHSCRGACAEVERELLECEAFKKCREGSSQRAKATPVELACADYLGMSDAEQRKARPPADQIPHAHATQQAKYSLRTIRTDFPSE